MRVFRKDFCSRRVRQEMEDTAFKNWRLALLARVLSLPYLPEGEGESEILTTTSSGGISG